VARKRIGDLLVDAGVVSREQLEEALESRRRHGRRERLGEAVVRLGLAREADVAAAVARQLRLDSVDVRGMTPPADALERVPSYLAERHDVLPLEVNGDVLVLATSDPSDTSALDDIRLVAGVRAVQPVVATPSGLTAARRQVYAVDATQQLLGAQAQLPDAPPLGAPSDDADEGEADLVTGSEDEPVIKLVDTLLADALASRASDLHLEPEAAGLRVRLRVDGLLRERGRIPAHLTNQVVSRVKLVGGLDITERRLPQDGRVQARIEDQRVDLRISSMPSLWGESLLLRLLPTGSAGLAVDELGFPATVRERLVDGLRQPQGLVLITGPTGSGKTTTLYAGLRAVMDHTRKVLTLEDPVEYVVPGIHQTQVDPRIGLTFERGLRHLVRHDPDVVLVGEIRDRETARLAVEASFTGHLVLATLHTNDAPSAVTRLRNLGVDAYVIAAALTLVIAQRLARTVCDHCQQPVAPDPELLRRLGLAREDLADANLRRGSGCPVCEHTGGLGRTAISEALPISPRLRTMIDEGASEAALARVGRAEGMRTLRQDAIDRAAGGAITLEEVLRITPEASADVVRCTGCQAVVGDDLHVCPWCATPLRSDACPECHRTLDTAWRACPWCGWDRA
jgi:type IV pilus assembly protein PilB